MSVMGQKVGVFVDAGNLFLATRSVLGRSVAIDYSALMDFAERYGEVVVARVYQPHNPANAGEAGFLFKLRAIGFQPVTRLVRVLPNGTIKGDMDVFLAIDAVSLAPSLDTVVIATGDGDFLPLVEHLRRLGKRVVGVGPHSCTAPELRMAFDEFAYTTEVDGLICDRLMLCH